MQQQQQQQQLQQQQYQQQQYEQQLQYEQEQEHLRQVQFQQQQQQQQYELEQQQIRQQQLYQQQYEESQRLYSQNNLISEAVTSPKITRNGRQQQQQQQHQQQQNGFYAEQNSSTSHQRSVQTYEQYNQSNNFRQETYSRQENRTNESQFVKPLPSFLRFSEGQPARLEIDTGSSAPVVTWYKDNMIIRNTPDTQITANSSLHTLRLPEIYPEDSGLYKAVIQTATDKTESVCEVRVES